MPRIQKQFGELEPSEAFSCDYAMIVEGDSPFSNRPHLWIRTDVDKAVFLPTGQVREFSLDKRVFSEEIVIKRK